MKRRLIFLVPLALAITPIMANEDSAPPLVTTPPAFELVGNVQLQAQRALWENVPNGRTRNNLDDFWGRANIGGSFNSKEFSALVNIRAYPEGWGYAPLTGLTIKDTAGSITQASVNTPIAKFQIEQAWVKYASPLVDIRLGRYYTTQSKSFSAGNYLDQDPTMEFLCKFATNNAIDVTFETGITSTNVLLGTTDSKLNSGYLRLCETIVPIKSMTMGLGYRVNVFDLVYNEHAKIDHRIGFNANYTILPQFTPYIELGIYKKSATKNQSTGKTLENQKDTVSCPFLLGTTIPTSGILNALHIETEYYSIRKVNNIKTGKTEKTPLTIGITADKKIGKRSLFQLGLISDAVGISADEMILSLCYTATIK